MSRLCVREKENMGLVRWVQGAGGGSGPQLTARPFGHRKYTFPLPKPQPKQKETTPRRRSNSSRDKRGRRQAKAAEEAGSGELHGAVKDQVADRLVRKQHRVARLQLNHLVVKGEALARAARGAKDVGG